MLAPRAYALTLAAAGLVVATGLMVLALYLIPLSPTEQVMGGNLARMGWHSKNAFGANTPQRLFDPPLFAIGNAIERAHDIVVLGDSFTLLHADQSWPNHLAARGLSVLAIGLVHDETKASDAADIEAQLETLLSSPGFRAHPPHVLVLEMVESTLRRRLVREPAACEDVPEVDAAGLRNVVAGALTLSPLQHETREVIVNARRYDEQQLTYARDFLLRNLERFLGRWTPEVREFALRSPRFSSGHPRTLLVVSHDVHKAQWTAGDLDRMRCQLLRLQAIVEATGTTRFVALLIPDKLSAYHADVLEPSVPGSVLDAVIDPRLNAPRVDAALGAAIEAGTLDVYLPDDTHFGAAGYAIAADAVARFMAPGSGTGTMARRARAGSP